MILLFPCDPIRPARPDSHFEDEYSAARDLEIPVALIDHDAAVAGSFGASCKKVPNDSGEAVYRGWMMRPDAYEGFELALSQRGIVLRTSASSYRNAHHLPQWYEAVREDTPQSVWTKTDSETELIDSLRQLPVGAAVLKDYSKSEKHYWNEAMFVPDTSDESHALKIARRFRELRGGSFDVGYVIRSFERFDGPEARTWWVDGQCVLITPHPDSGQDDQVVALAELTHLQTSINRIDARFVTADVTRRVDDGAVRIVEVGDGQVSDRPSGTDPIMFINSIAASETHAQTTDGEKS